MKLYLGNKNYSSWSLRGFLVTKLSGESFEEVPVQLTGHTPNPANLGFSPSGLVPCLHDGDVVVWDSMAIAGYLAERHPEMWPDDSAACTVGGTQAADAQDDSRAAVTACPTPPRRSPPGP
jgi:glutathione S-transferase